MENEVEHFRSLFRFLFLLPKFFITNLLLETKIRELPVEPLRFRCIELFSDTFEQGNEIVSRILLPYIMPGDGGGGGGAPIWNGRGCSSVQISDFGRLECSGKNVIIFSRQGLVKGCTRRNNQTERILIPYIYSIHINKVFHIINILSPL